MSTYSSIILADTPVAFYEFDDGTANDDSGNGNNGAFSGGTVIVPGLVLNTATQPPQAVSFDGSTGIDTLPKAFFTALNAFSFECWIVPSSLGSFERIFELGSNGGTVLYFTPNNDSNKVELGVFNGSFLSRCATTVGLSVNQRYYLVVTVDGSKNVSIYINGVLQGTGTVFDFPSQIPTPTGLLLGVSTYGFASTYLNGTLDEVAFYGYALTSGQVTAHYEAGAPVAFYALDDLAVESRVHGEYDLAPIAAPPFSIISVTVIDAAHVMVTFSAVIANNGAANEAENYVITPTVNVQNAAVIGTINPTSVMLTVSPMVTGQNYTLEAQRIRPNVEVPLTGTFVGLAPTPPVVHPTVSQIVTDVTDLANVTVIYSEAVKQVNPANSNDALNPSNYTLTDVADGTTLAILGVATVSATTVTLTVRGQQPSRVYKLTVVNVQDLNGNVIQ